MPGLYLNILKTEKMLQFWDKKLSTRKRKRLNAKIQQTKFPARLQIQSRRTTDRRHPIGVLNAQLPGARLAARRLRNFDLVTVGGGQFVTAESVWALYARAIRQATRRGLNFRETRWSERTGEYREHS